MSKPKWLIKPEEAKVLSDEFTARNRVLSKRIVGRSDNRSCWWSVEDIEEFLAHAKKQARAKGHELNGIRAYFGAYAPNQGKVGESTIFMVPTASIVDGKDGPGDTADIPDADGFNFGGPGDPPGSGYPQS